MIRKIEIRMSQEELAQTLEAIFAETVHRTGEIFDGRSLSGRLAKSDKVVLDAVHQSSFKLMKP